MAAPRLVCSIEEVREFFVRIFPQATIAIEELTPGGARIRQTIGHAQLRPGGTVAGPVMMAVADAGAYAALLGAIGIVPLAVTSNLNITFFRRPSPDRDVIGEATLLKVGRRLAFADVRLYSDGEPEPIGQATVTYAIPPDAEAVAKENASAFKPQKNV